MKGVLVSLKCTRELGSAGMDSMWLDHWVVWLVCMAAMSDAGGLVAWTVNNFVLISGEAGLRPQACSAAVCLQGLPEQAGLIFAKSAKLKCFQVVQWEVYQCIQCTG